MLFSASLVDIGLPVSICIIFLIYKYCTRNSEYWRKRNVPSLNPIPVIGNLWELFTLRASFGIFLRQMYFSTDAPYMGFYIFNNPVLLIRKPEIIKELLVKEFHHFQDRTMQTPSHNELLSNVLFSQKNPEWKWTRAKLTPVFSSAKMKGLFHTVNNVCDEWISYIRSNSAEQEPKDICHRFSTEVTTQAFFGVVGRCFEREDSEFSKHAKAMFGFTLRNAFIQSLYFFKGHLVDLFKLDFLHVDIQTFFRDAFWKCMNDTEGMKSKTNNFIGILKDMKESDPRFDGDKIAAQGLMFYVAGTETTSTTISFTLYEFARNPCIQEKARTEVKSIIDQEGLTYESLKNMKYLEMCIQETLRKYPPIPFLDRRCNADYRIPGTDIVIEKDVSVYISLLGIQNDEKYYPEPEKFIPERFQNNGNAAELVYAPFGSGPRTCIASRFGMMSTKLALVHILCEFRVENVKETPSSIEFDPKCVTLSSKNALVVKFHALE